MINKWNRQALALALWLIAPLSAVSAAEVASSSAAPVQPVPSPVPADYVIGPGDTLQIFVWRNPELTVSVPVRPDGKISSPLVQDMVAVGKTPTNLSHDIEAVLGEFVRSPQVNVIVTTPAGLMSQVKVVGPDPVPAGVLLSRRHARARFGAGCRWTDRLRCRQPGEDCSIRRRQER
jgi:polysaccharide export outer membrane protein